MFSRRYCSASVALVACGVWERARWLGESWRELWWAMRIWFPKSRNVVISNRSEIGFYYILGAIPIGKNEGGASLGPGSPPHLFLWGGHYHIISNHGMVNAHPCWVDNISRPSGLVIALQSLMRVCEPTNCNIIEFRNSWILKKFLIKILGFSSVEKTRMKIQTSRVFKKHSRHKFEISFFHKWKYLL